MVHPKPRKRKELTSSAEPTIFPHNSQLPKTPRRSPRKRRRTECATAAVTSIGEFLPLINFTVFCVVFSSIDINKMYTDIGVFVTKWGTHTRNPDGLKYFYCFVSLLRAIHFRLMFFCFAP